MPAGKKTPPLSRGRDTGRLSAEAAEEAAEPGEGGSDDLRGRRIGEANVFRRPEGCPRDDGEADLLEETRAECVRAVDQCPGWRSATEGGRHVGEDVERTLRR